MLGQYASLATGYLLVLSILTTLFFAIPIAFAPLRWARLMLWPVPEHTHLAIYFGRCLGALLLVLEFFMFQAARSGIAIEFVFQFLFGVYGLMLLLHIDGAIRRLQPITETLEIGFWAVMLVLNTLFYPVA